jgi:NAD(P)-dependent dehydrogenase (short-subunit alcohol dehydrogenase family)
MNALTKCSSRKDNSRIGELESIQDVVPLQADVRNEDQVNQLFTEAARKNGGPVSVLVVNHGVWPANNA